MTRLGKRQRQVMLFFAQNTDKWYTHRELCEKLELDYNANKLRKPLRRMKQAGLIKKEMRDQGPSNKKVNAWKTKDL